MQAVVEVENLTHYYARGTPLETKSLDSVSLEVYEGEFLALIGSAGSGKSTLIQHFNGLLQPSRGCIRVFHGKEEVKGQQLWQRVGLVFQIPERQLFAETVHDELAFGLINMSVHPEEIKGRVVSALGQVGLDYCEFGRRSPLALSQGQQRRVAIASVLAMEPSILVLDEPTAGIDPAGRREFWANIRRLREKRIFTTVLVTHNMDEVAELADRVILMEQGRVVFTGTPGEVFAKHALIRNLGLGLPFGVRLMDALHNCGKDVDLNVLTYDHAESEITKRLGLEKGGGVD